MTCVKRLTSIALVMVVLVSIFSMFTMPVSAASLNNCKWNTKYKFVTSKGDSYGTNTFIIYGKLGKRTVTLKSECFAPLDCQKNFLKTVKFSIKIYKGSQLKQTYLKGLNESFTVPAGLGTKYTVKITPVIDKKAFNKVGGYGVDSYYYYSLFDGKK